MQTIEERLTHLSTVAVAELVAKDSEYGGSWKKRGGVGAYMMLARKWDRLENHVQKHGWNIFAAYDADDRPEGILDDIRDLKAYLMLVEDHLLLQKTQQYNAYRQADIDLQCLTDPDWSHTPEKGTFQPPVEVNGLPIDTKKLTPTQRTQLLNELMSQPEDNTPSADILNPQ